jgi:hypothetical protein
VSSPSVGGAFNPNADYTITGNWSYTNTPTIGSGAYVTTGATQTLTAKTLTAPVITGIVAGVPDLTLALGTANVKFCSAQVDVTSSATLVNVTGLTGFAVVAAGVYRFDINLSGTSGGSGGMKVAFKLSTTTLTDLEAMATGFTASAIACQHTTTATDQASLYAQTAAVIGVRITGRITVNAAGTIAVQFAQNASDGTASSVYVGSSAAFTRVA